MVISRLAGIGPALLVAVVGQPVVVAATAALAALITGWQDPGPEIVNGCSTHVMCSEPIAFFAIWVLNTVGLGYATYWLWRQRWRASEPG